MVRRLFIETDEFKAIVKELKITQEQLQLLQIELLANPNKGDLMVGTGGARKVRMGRKGSGKSGGYRVMYLDLSHAGVTYLIYLFDKGEPDNLTAPQKAWVKSMVEAIKAEY